MRVGPFFKPVFFQRKGYEVTVCLTGQEALKRVATISRNGFDLILQDYKKTDFNGLDVLSQIRRIEVKTPVILMTAYGTTGLAIGTMKRGALAAKGPGLIRKGGFVIV